MKVKLVKSRIGCSPNQRRNLQALGLKRIGQVKELPAQEATRGKINKVKHLIEVIES